MRAALPPTTHLPGLLAAWALAALAQITAPAQITPEPTPSPDQALEFESSRPAPASTITTIRELRDLSVEGAADSRLVRVTGVVTYFEPLRTLAFIQDETGGSFFSSVYNDGSGTERPRLELSVGDLVELEGLSAPGSFAPYIRRPPDSYLPRAKVLGRAPFPEPLRVDAGRLLDPSLDAHWVETRATVRQLRRFHRRLQLEVSNGLEEFTVIIPGDWPTGSLPDELLGSTIRVRGVYGSVTDQNRRLVAARIYTPGLEQIEILDEGSRKAFKTQPRPVGQLLQYRGDTNARVHVRGVVTGAFPGRYFFLRSGEDPLIVTTTSARPPEVGREVSVVGFPTPVADGVALHTTDFRLGPWRPHPQPINVAPADLNRPRWHGELVRTEARLLDSFVSGRECILLFGDGGTPFSARLTLPEGAEPPELPHESFVQVTGIAFLDQSGPIPAESPDALRSLSILLRGAEDLHLLRAPPFWTRERVIVGAGATLAALLLAGVWVVLLRRQVAEQTALIADKIEQEKVADERARIARELHDTVEQELAGIGLQLDLALARVAHAPERARNALDLALRMLRRTQGETRRSIQDLRDEGPDRSDLAAALADTAREFREEKGAPLHDRIESPAQALPALAEQHLLRIAREAVGNAARHAGASRIDLVLENTPAGLRLLIADDGAGFDPAAPHPGHFGLRGMRERALKIGARFELETRTGAGSRITVLLPAP
jgi:signal transduction histidine kinase